MIEPSAVFDTNILISALLSLRGAPFRCLALARLGAVQSVTCEPSLDEFSEKLISKFRYSVERARLAAEEVRRFSRIVIITGDLRAVAADPDDDMVIECAVVGNARYIVTGDRRHLLPLERYGDIEIIDPTAFLSRLIVDPGPTP